MRRLCLILIGITGFLLLVLGGCNEAQISRKVWGQGDLPSDWQDFFGEGNIARLDFVQTQAINKQGQAIAVLAERVRKLEADPNDVKKKGL